MSTWTPYRLAGREQEIVDRLYEANLDLANSPNDDDRRKLAKKIAEQFTFEFGPEWGWKSNHNIPGDFDNGKDSVAKRLGPYTPGERQLLLIFDLFNGASRKPNRNPTAVPEEESTQYFVPVDPVNHLGAPPVDEPKKPEEPQGPALPSEFELTIREALGRISSVEQDVIEFRKDFAQAVTEIKALLNRPYQAETKAPFLGTVKLTLTPKN